MTNAEILQIAMEQSAIDSHCSPEDFLSGENKVVISGTHPKARKYLQLPFFCDLTSYGNNIVASVSEKVAATTKEYINRYPVEHCFEPPNLHVLNHELLKHGMQICFMAEYFLPDINALKPPDCPYETRVMLPEDFADCYLPQWRNALCEDRKHLDVLAVGAYDKGNLIGLAGCSADCDTMWQIGVDVLPPYRRKGIASALTGKLAIEILNREKVPFYCCAWSNIPSVRNAVASGFRPTWVQMTAKSTDFVANMNHQQG